MRIGIVGSGNIGGGLAGRLAELKHDVRVSNSRGAESLADFAAETGATATEVEDAVRDADVAVVAVPLRAVPDLPADAFAGKLVVDANNYYPSRDGRIADIDGGTPSSVWVAQNLSGATVVKTFNNIMAGHLTGNGRPAGEPGRIALPVAGDDHDAKQTVMELVDQLGFDPVDAGSLADSWRQEPGTLVYTTDRDVAGVEHGLAAAQR